MKSLIKVAAVSTTAVLAAGAMGAATTAAVAQNAPVPQGPAVQQAAATQFAGAVKLEQVQGTFSFSQNEVATNAELNARIGGASKYLCGSMSVDAPASDVMSWAISVEGAVQSPFQTTIGELIENADPVTLIMGCTCAGNPADGVATANAEVTGVPITDIIEAAGVAEGANTVVVVSADGYEVALPLNYLYQHYCPVVFDVNGSPLVESVGGTNQLWLGSTAASYFARDIVSIRVEARDQAPASPASDEARAAFENLPNVGVIFGGEVC